MATDKKSFLLYTDLIHTVEKLDNDHAGELFKHILRYVNDQNPEPKDFVIDIAFEPIKQALKRDLKRYESIKERNRVNGAKGGRPPKEANPDEPKKPTGLSGNPKNPDEPKKADNDIDSVIGIDNDSVSTEVDLLGDKQPEKPKKKFTKPTVAEIQAYCLERKNTVDPNRFFDYYESNGWVIGKGSMKNWQAAVRTWERNKFNNAQPTQPTAPKIPIVKKTGYEGFNFNE